MCVMRPQYPVNNKRIPNYKIQVIQIKYLYYVFIQEFLVKKKLGKILCTNKVFDVFIVPN